MEWLYAFAIKAGDSLAGAYEFVLNPGKMIE
jgi:hypothetical protein